MRPAPGPQCQYPGCPEHHDVTVSFDGGVRCPKHRTSQHQIDHERALT